MGHKDCIVPVSKEDSEALKKHCKEIGDILDRYPDSNNPTVSFYTSMMRVKNYHAQLKEWIDILPVK